MPAFKIDENLPIEFAEMLRSAGHAAATVNEQGMGGTDDPHVAEICRAERRALVTLDLDFADIRLYPPGAFSGFVVLRAAVQDKPHLISMFRRVLPLLSREPLEGWLWLIDERGVRFRGPDGQ